MYIKFFSQISKKDVVEVGGKGASLGEMTRTDFPVPPGFVITANVCRQFFATEIPIDLQEEILKSFDQLGVERVAVRSSAVAEDSSTASWAGQLESYLNTTRADLIERVRDCWNSIKSERALAYAAQQNVSEDQLAVAVVVQKMVESESAGVMFSVNPITKNTDEVMIEAGFGLGEMLVQGIITPDNFMVGKKDLEIKSKDIQTQETMLAFQGGKSMEVPVPEDKKNKATLTDDQVKELTKLAIEIENHYGFPCDIEWALEKGKLYIIQSRPITTLTDSRDTKINGNKNKKRIFKKIFNRYMPIYAAQYSYIGKSQVVSKILGNTVNFPPLFINKPDKGTSVYYEIELYEENSRKTLEYFKNNPDAMYKLCADYRKIYYDNINLVENAKIRDIKKLFDLNAYYITPLVTILILVGREEYDKKLKKITKIARDTRYWNDKILYFTGIKIFELINKKFNLNDDTGDYITIEEALGDKLPPKREIEKRRKSWVMIDDKTLYTGNKINEFLNKHGIVLKEEIGIVDKNLTTFIGRSAQRGYVKGIVKVIFTMQDVEKVKEGEVIVSPMTGPDFILAINKASAIITDEGGITCHAAIIARELNKLCIIGTKIATEVLKDGDLVEINADKGIVRILNK